MAEEGAQVLLSVEAEAYVQALETFAITKIGSQRWHNQHEYLEKLNMQAVVNASAQEDEFIKEFFVTYEKIPVLIHELLAVEVWKEKIFPELVEMEFEAAAQFPIYMILYHEATLANLLETMLYHREVCESAEDSTLDLLDYCYRKLTDLIARTEEVEEEEEEETDPRVASASETSAMQELEKQERKLQFDICMKAVSILRYITDNIESLPLSVTTRLLNTLDIPLMLVHLVENPPWTRKREGKLEKYVDNKWQTIDEVERFRLTKIEGQVWIGLFHLLMDASCQQKYELDSFRKNSILKLRSYLNEVVLDQMPVLGEMQRYLEHLSLMEPAAVKKDLILEQVPEIRNKMLNDNEGKWRKIAKVQSETYFNPAKVDMRQQAKRLADTYNFDVLENLMSEPPKCVVCGQSATKRCSRCQNEWYCRRECQVGHWKKHKPACNLLVEAVQKVKEQEASAT